MNPEYVETMGEDAVVFRNYEGRRFEYPLTSTRVQTEALTVSPAPAPPDAAAPERAAPIPLRD
jgi:hypothetical protein